MIETLFQLLFGYEGFIQEKQLFKLISGHAPIDIDTLRNNLKEDQRFIVEDDSWASASLKYFVPDQTIPECTFIVTDIETTGSIQGKDRIIDLAAQKIKNGKVIATFEKLIDPEKNISYTISKITGISNKDVQGAPKIEEILPQFNHFVGDGIFTAHNSDFDYRFIRAEQCRLQVQSFKTPIDICTYRIAKKLLPNLKTCGISGLATYFDFDLKVRHRALPDVEAASFFFQQFIEQMKELEINTLHQLINFQKKRFSKKNLQKKLKNAHRKRINQKRSKNQNEI